jgi:hypothetical protein
MTGLFLDLSDYYTDPVIEEIDRGMMPTEEYDIIPSRSNVEGWDKIKNTRGIDKRPRKKKQPATPSHL